MSFSILIFAAIVLFLFLVFGVVISSFFLSNDEPAPINKVQREQKKKLVSELVERSSIEEKLRRKISTPEEIKEGEPIHILENEGNKVEVKRQIPPQHPPNTSSQTPQTHRKTPPRKSITPKKDEEKPTFPNGKLATRGVIPKTLLAEHKKEEKFKQEKEKRGEMKKELQDRSSIYKDPTEGVCVHTRADCSDLTSDCFLGAGHLDLKECIEKAERIQENINKHNERFGSADTRRKSNVKYISWAPPNIYPDVNNPQCMILGETANVLNDQKGWKTYVKNPTSFTMTQNPSVYLVEGKCPTVKE